MATASGRVLVAHGRCISCFGPTGELISTARVDATVVSLLASASGRFLVCATRSRIFVLYTATLREVKTIDSLPPAAVRSLAVHPGGRAIIAGFDRGLIGVYATDLTFYAAL
jgi:sugar lactone lactonase YvrE